MEPTFDIQPNTQEPTQHRFRKNIVWGVGIIFVAALLIGGVYWYNRYTHKKYISTPEGQLEMLRSSSEPITVTNSDRAKELDSLQKKSDKISTPIETRIQDLQALEQR